MSALKQSTPALPPKSGLTARPLIFVVETQCLLHVRCRAMSRVGSEEMRRSWVILLGGLLLLAFLSAPSLWGSWESMESEWATCVWDMMKIISCDSWGVMFPVDGLRGRRGTVSV